MQAHITAITLAVKDLDAIKGFYTEKFGWQILAENEKVVMLKLDNLVLSLCDELLFTDYTNISNNARSKSFYLTINLATKAEVDDKISRLEQNGVQIIKHPANTFWGGYAAFIADFEGNCWEICYNPYTAN
ncbi:VOC family protein [Mucilaginibacter sp. SMC90]|uniref:VOC family protein n=1 Tax=Mucilaginibacter sp. SMC90 TaxID=2929803 RepID=UPI001FB39287|nr:VOC family protein [Mucilaginibacter sp. SMC90]UOE47058.1 VOC family protein [Mucilaginibacter sp. SMC90]